MRYHTQGDKPGKDHRGHKQIVSAETKQDEGQREPRRRFPIIKK